MRRQRGVSVPRPHPTQRTVPRRGPETYNERIYNATQLWAADKLMACQRAEREQFGVRSLAFLLKAKQERYRQIAATDLL